MGLLSCSRPTRVPGLVPGIHFVYWEAADAQGHGRYLLRDPSDTSYVIFDAPPVRFARRSKEGVFLRESSEKDTLEFRTTIPSSDRQRDLRFVLPFQLAPDELDASWR